MLLGQILFATGLAAIALVWMGALVRESVVEWRRSRKTCHAGSTTTRQSLSLVDRAGSPPLWPLHDPDEDDENLVRPYYWYWERRRVRLDEIATLAAERAAKAIQELTAAADAEVWGRS